MRGAGEEQLKDRDARPGGRGRHGLRGNAAFTRLWLGEALSDAGSQVTTIAMPLLVLALSGSAAEAGLVGVARAVAQPLSVIPGGVLADRVDRRRLMMACAAGRAAVLGSVALALALGRPSLAQLLLVTLIDAVLGSVAYVAERGLLPQIVSSEALPEAVTLNEARSAAAVLAGPPAGGALFGLARALPFAADTASFLVALAALAGLRVPPGSGAHAARREPAGVVAQAREGLSWLWHQPFLRAGSLLYAVENVSINALELLGLLILHRHGVSSAGIGAAYAIVGGGGLLGAAIANPLRRRVSARRAVLAEPWLYALLIPGLLLLHTVVGVGLLIGAMFVPMTLSTSTIVGRRLALAPEHLRGRVQASGSFLAGSLSWAGPLAMGLLVQYTGESAAVLVLTGWALATALAATLAPALRSVPSLS